MVANDDDGSRICETASLDGFEDIADCVVNAGNGEPDGVSFAAECMFFSIYAGEVYGHEGGLIGSEDIAGYAGGLLVEAQIVFVHGDAVEAARRATLDFIDKARCGVFPRGCDPIPRVFGIPDFGNVPGDVGTHANGPFHGGCSHANFFERLPEGRHFDRIHEPVPLAMTVFWLVEIDAGPRGQCAGKHGRVRGVCVRWEDAFEMVGVGPFGHELLQVGRRPGPVEVHVVAPSVDGEEDDVAGGLGVDGGCQD